MLELYHRAPQTVGGSHVTALGGEIGGSFAVVAERCWIGFVREEKVNDIVAAGAGRAVEGRKAVLLASIHVGAVSDQQAHDFEVAIRNRGVDGGDF